MPVLALFGSYDPEHPRLRVLIEAWRARGGTIVECHAPLWPDDRAGLPSGGLLRWIFPWLGTQWRLWRQRKILREADAVLVPYPGHFDMPLARHLAWRYEKQLAFDPFLSLYDTAVTDRGLYAPNTPQARLLRFIDRFSLRLADLILADTSPMAAYYAKLAALPPERFSVIPIGADNVFSPPPEGGCPAGFPPTSPARVHRTEAGDAIQVLFYGTMIPLHGITTILDAARQLQDAPIRFHLVGEGQVPLARMLAEHPLPNVHHTPSVPRAQLPALLTEADICLGVFGTSPKTARVVPHKVYEAAAMGKPIITADTPAMREAFDEAVALVPAGDATALATAIRELAVAPVRRQAMGVAAHKRFEQAFSLEAIGDRLTEALG
ncbi:MAG TPA: glycosyltransferase family 4 protein [Oscillatoriaceae cyanobacterium]